MRILVIKLADIGDALTATPALRALRKTFPTAHITVLTKPAPAMLLRDLPTVDEVIVSPGFRYIAPGSHPDPADLLALLRLLRRLWSDKFDITFVFHHLTSHSGALKYALLVGASRAGLRVGLDNGRGFFLNRKVSDAGFGGCHEVDYWLQVVAVMGARPVLPVKLELAISEADQAWAGMVLATGPWGERRGPLVAIHPGSGAYTLARRWPAARFAAVADRLSRERQARIVLIGGPDDAEASAAMLAESREPVLNLAGQTTLGRLAALLSACDLFIGGDSGVMHLAVAAGTAVVALFGPTNHRAWGPYAPAGRATVLRVDRPGCPCLYVGHQVGNREGCAGRECLNAITPEMVYQAAINSLSAEKLAAVSKE